jgi:hypothetical protein
LLKVFETETLSPDFGLRESGVKCDDPAVGRIVLPDFFFVYSIVRVKGVAVDWKVACVEEAWERRRLVRY